MRENRYLLREDDPGNEGNGKDPPAADPPKEDLPKEETPPTIPMSILPQDLQDKSEAEIKFILERMATGLVSSNESTRNLQEQLLALQDKVDNPPAPPEPDEFAEISDEDLIVTNPTAAITRILEREGLTKRFASLEERTGEGMLLSVGRSIADFDEYEDDVRTIMKSSNVPMDDVNIRGSYAMAVGLRAIADREKSERSAASLTPPPAGEIEKTDLPALTGLEAEVFEASGMTRTDWGKYQADDSGDVEVPLG